VRRTPSCSKEVSSKPGTASRGAGWRTHAGAVTGGGERVAPRAAKKHSKRQSGAWRPRAMPARRMGRSVAAGMRASHGSDAGRRLAARLLPVLAGLIAQGCVGGERAAGDMPPALRRMDPGRCRRCGAGDGCGDDTDYGRAGAGEASARGGPSGVSFPVAGRRRRAATRG
jgi:hypothetical protein